MKYIFFVWNESLSSFFDYEVERSSQSEDFEVHVFAKTGAKPFKLLNNPKYYKLHEVNTNNDEFLFTALALSLQKKNFFSYRDELILIDSNQGHCNYVFDQLISNNSILEKSNCSWIPVGSSRPLSSFFPTNRVCSKCKIIFGDTYAKASHERNNCSYCRKPECCGEPSRHEKIFQHDHCKAVNCDFRYRRCCPNELEQHLKNHPECPTCKKIFINMYSFCRESFSSHLQTYKQCSHCKEMTCNGKDHSFKVWVVCKGMGCDHTFANCIMDESHLSTHPKCNCGCEKRFLNEEKLNEHLYPFQCKDCHLKFRKSSVWFQHSQQENHVLLCSCEECSTVANPYFAKAKKMKSHLMKKAFCKCGEIFYSNEALGYHQKKCNIGSVPPPVPSTTTIKQTERKPSGISIGTAIISPSIELDLVDVMLAKVVNENFPLVDFPMWTMTKDEKEDLNAIRVQIQNHLSSAKLFQLRVQGSAVKNTVIPAMADLDFILEVRNDSTTMSNLKEEISEIFNKANCRFCYGNGKIQTWLTLDKNIFFDVVIKFSTDTCFQDFERNVNLVKQQPNNVHSFIRALKYWCKRSNAPLKSFILEFIGIHLFSRSLPRYEFIQFLVFLQRKTWIDEINGLVEAPTTEDLIRLQNLATATFNALQSKK